MKLFNRNQNSSFTVIIGCGRLGAGFANALSNEGENVLIIDESADAFKQLSSNFGGLSIVADGTDIDRLAEEKIENATAVIAATNDDNTNLMVAQIAKEVFGVERVIARLYDPEIELIYKRMGINTICPAVLTAKEINSIINGTKEEDVS